MDGADIAVAVRIRANDFVAIAMIEIAPGEVFGDPVHATALPQARLALAAQIAEREFQVRPPEVRMLALAGPKPPQLLAIGHQMLIADGGESSGFGGAGFLELGDVADREFDRLRQRAPR